MHLSAPLLEVEIVISSDIVLQRFFVIFNCSVHYNVALEYCLRYYKNSLFFGVIEILRHAYLHSLLNNEYLKNSGPVMFEWPLISFAPI